MFQVTTILSRVFTPANTPLLTTKLKNLKDLAAGLFFMMSWDIMFGPMYLHVMNSFVNSVTTLCPIPLLAPARTLLSLNHMVPANMVNAICLSIILSGIYKAHCAYRRILPDATLRNVCAFSLPITVFVDGIMPIISRVAGNVFNMIQALVPFAPLYHVSDGNLIFVMANIFIVTALWQVCQLAYEGYQLVRTPLD